MTPHVIYPPENRLTVALPSRWCKACRAFVRNGGSCPGMESRIDPACWAPDSKLATE